AAADGDVDAAVAARGRGRVDRRGGGGRRRRGRVRGPGDEQHDHAGGEGDEHDQRHPAPGEDRPPGRRERSGGAHDRRTVFSRSSVMNEPQPFLSKTEPFRAPDDDVRAVTRGRATGWWLSSSSSSWTGARAR